MFLGLLLCEKKSSVVKKDSLFIRNRLSPTSLTVHPKILTAFQFPKMMSVIIYLEAITFGHLEVTKGSVSLPLGKHSNFL